MAKWVYVLESGGFYKIGWTTNVDGRVHTLQQGNPHRLVVVYRLFTPYAQQVEVALHRRYAARRLHGEWYVLTPEDLADLPVQAKGEAAWAAGRRTAGFVSSREELDADASYLDLEELLAAIDAETGTAQEDASAIDPETGLPLEELLAALRWWTRPLPGAEQGHAVGRAADAQQQPGGAAPTHRHRLRRARAGGPAPPGVPKEAPC